MTYDIDRASADTRRLWLRVGRVLARVAVREAEKGYADDAARKARIADYCFWQASGEGELTQWKDLYPPSGAAQ